MRRELHVNGAGAFASPADTIPVALACDRPEFARKVQGAFDDGEPFRLVFQTTGGEDVNRGVAEHKPLICILNLGRSQGEILEAVRRFSSAGVRVLVAGDASDTRFSMELVVAGGWGLIDEDIDSSMLAKCFAAVSAGQLWITRKTMADLVRLLRVVDGRFTMDDEGPSASASSNGGREFDPADLDYVWRGMSLTPREVEIARAIANGHTNREIANAFGISLNTVKCHISRIFQKAGVRSRSRLIRVAIERGATPAIVH